MSEPTESSPPRAPSTRLDGLDVARGIAFTGMVLVNYGVVMAMGGRNPAWIRELREACTGRAAALFVLLAGAGLALMVARAAARDPGRGAGEARRVYARRALALLVGGYAFYPFWEGDILHYYGVYLALGALLAPLRSRWLLLLAIVAVGGFVAIYQWWIPYRWSDVLMPSFWTWAGQAKNLFYNGWHPLFPWFAFFLTGMAVGRLPLGRLGVQLTLAFAGAALACASHYGSAAVIDSLREGDLPRYTTAPLISLFGTSCLPPGPLYVLEAIGTALCVIGAASLFARAPRLLWLPAARVGRLALTLYVAHVVVGLGLWEALGGREGRGDLEEVFRWWLWTVVASLAFATLWLQWLRRGPLELVLRKLCG
ncbi:MAG: heparan-alpha-glucosaminide N-acetyltransferase domain-containing protein [Planctomycetota bacterium]|nr:heparan-alpha-glucosaminide N-acetyltransferase domain-containing protein [Planctomycetota bacterium]